MYENVQIGNFILMLGYFIGKRKEKLGGDFYAALLQQTPVDQKLADLLSGINGKNVLIEFKRKKYDKVKEKQKRANILEKLEVLSNKKIKEIAFNAHYLCKEKESRNVKISKNIEGNFGALIPYFSIEKNIKEKSIVDFLGKKIGVNNESMLEYIKFLIDNSDGSGGGNLDYSYLLMNISSKGKLSCQVLSLDKALDKSV